MESNRVEREFGGEQELQEKQRKNLTKLQEAISDLFKSLYGNATEDSIKGITSKILNEQRRQPVNESLIDGYKAELMGAYIPHRNKLLTLVFDGLPPKFLSDLNKEGIILKNLPDDMMDSIANLMRQPLNNDTGKNAFQLAQWIEKIQKIQMVIKKHLQ